MKKHSAVKALNRALEDWQLKFDVCYSNLMASQDHIKHLEGELRTTTDCYNHLAVRFEEWSRVLDTAESEDMEMKL